MSIIGAGDALALQSWLRENGFQTNLAAQELLDTYIRRNWAFVAVKLHPAEKRHYENEFLSALTIQYCHDQIIFPLLVSAMSTDRIVKFSLYAVAESTVTSSNFHTTHLRVDEDLADGVDPINYIDACIRRTIGAYDGSGLVVTESRGPEYWGIVKKSVQRLMKAPFSSTNKFV